MFYDILLYVTFQLIWVSKKSEIKKLTLQLIIYVQFLNWQVVFVLPFTAIFSLRSGRLKVTGERKNGTCEGDTRGERERLPGRTMIILFSTPIQLPGSRCVICQKFLQETIIRANDNNSERFFKFMPLVSASFHQSGPGFDGIRSVDNPSREVLFEQIIFPLIFISTMRQIFCLPPLLLMRI